MTAFATSGQEPASNSSAQLSPTVGYYIRKLLRQRGLEAPVDPTADLGTVLRSQYRDEGLSSAIASLERLVQYHQVLSSQGSQHQGELTQAEQEIFQILEQPLLEPEAEAEPAASEAAPETDERTDRILRIDERGEERDKADPLMTLLAPHNYQVQHRRYNPDLVDSLGHPIPDVIVIELKMSEQGIELCQALRQRPEFCTVPVIMVSALHSVSDRLKALKLGVTDYLVQPVQPLEMQARIENHVAIQRQRKQLERKIQQLQTQLIQSQGGASPMLAQAVLDQSGDYLLFINEGNQIVHANDAASELLGYSREELLQLSMDMLDVRLAPQDWKTIWEHLRAHQTLNLDSAHVAKSGETLDVQMDLQFLQVNGEAFSYLSAKRT